MNSRAGKGDLVRFADYVPLADGLVGHPHGLEWFCADHVLAAEALAGKKINEAMLELQRVFGAFPAAPIDMSVERSPVPLRFNDTRNKLGYPCIFCKSTDEAAANLLRLILQRQGGFASIPSFY